MRKHREHPRRSLLAAALLAIATGPTWAGDTTQAEEQMYRRHLLSELRQDLRESIRTLSLERADVVQRIANQEAAGLAASNRGAPVREDAARPRGRKSSGATL